MPLQQRQTTKGVPGLASDPSILDENGESCEESEEDSYDSESDTCDSEEGLGYTVATKDDYEPPIEVKKKAKTKGGKQGILEDSETPNDTDESNNLKPTQASEWTQIQQKTFEQAIKSFPKGTDERWERIASKVGGKTKEDCIIRFKYLAEMVKKKKENSS